MVFQIFSFLILTVFYVCYFIKMLSQKKHGVKCSQIGFGKTGFVKWVECTMMTASILVVIVELVNIIFNISFLPSLLRWIGFAIAVLGDIVFICAVLTMRDSWRVGVGVSDQTKLVTNGVFSISRNPAFLGFDLVYIGILLMFCNWLLYAVSAFAALMLHLQIVNVEEPFLQEKFGNEYLEYTRKVSRYLGRKPDK